MNEFSVCQFFPNETYEYAARFVSAKEAATVMGRLIRSVGAKQGTTRRVIITDGGDCINAEWTFEEGITFPPEWIAAAKERRVK